jgi:antitoxin ParD1/3/4
MTIQLNPELEDIVPKQVATGRYHSAAEVLRDALSLLEKDSESRELRLQGLEEKIDQALESLKQGKGIDGEEFFDKLHRQITGSRSAI